MALLMAGSAAVVSLVLLVMTGVPVFTWLFALALLAVIVTAVGSLAGSA
jgi:hypothetical protein